MTVDWLTGARLRGDLQENEDYFGMFIMLDVKRASTNEKKFSEGDAAILLAVQALRDMLYTPKVNFVLYRVGGDEFVLVTDDNGLAKIKRRTREIAKNFHFAIEKKIKTETWVEALDRAWEQIQKKKRR